VQRQVVSSTSLAAIGFCSTGVAWRGSSERSTGSGRRLRMSVCRSAPPSADGGRKQADRNRACSGQPTVVDEMWRMSGARSPCRRCRSANRVEQRRAVSVAPCGLIANAQADTAVSVCVAVGPDRDSAAGVGFKPTIPLHERECEWSRRRRWWRGANGHAGWRPPRGVPPDRSPPAEAAGVPVVWSHPRRAVRWSGHSCLRARAVGPTGDHHAGHRGRRLTNVGCRRPRSPLF